MVVRKYIVNTFGGINPNNISVMKRIVVLSVFILLVTNSFAQLFTVFGREIGFFYAGPKVGMNFSQITNSSSEFVDVKNRVGYQFGAIGEIGLTQRFSFQGELTFISRGMKQESNWGTTTSTSKLRVGYLGIPLLAKLSFKMLGLSKVYAMGGTYNNIRTGGAWVYEGGETYPIESAGWTALDWGLSFGCGAEYKMDQGIIGLDLRYDLGVIDVHKSDALRNMNRTFGFTLVYKFDMVDLLSKKRNDKHDES